MIIWLMFVQALFKRRAEHLSSDMKGGIFIMGLIELICEMLLIFNL